MKMITLEEFQQKKEELFLVDIRKEEDFRGGTFFNAVSAPAKQLLQEGSDKKESLWNLIKEQAVNKPIVLLNYTGRQNENLVERMEDHGFDVLGLEGGFRSCLRHMLEEQVKDEEATAVRVKEIEHSLIKKFRKPVWRKFTKAVTEYELIQPGDKIAVCISGGKDSMLMAKLFQEIQRHGKIPFELEFLVMNPGYNEENWSIIQNNAKILGIPLTVCDSEIFDIVADIDQNPCYLCARMRRGFLYANAQKLGCNKIALGHHFDDVIETILMGMLYGGKIETMMPKLHSQHFSGMQLIRPLYLVKEEAVKAWRDYNKLHFIQCACRFTENNENSDGYHVSKRDEMKQLIRQFRATSDVIENNIFSSVRNINLNTVIGYHKDDMVYNFLDDFEKKIDKNE